MTSFTGHGIKVFHAAVVAQALGLAQHGIRATRGPRANVKHLMAEASRITGKTFKTRDYAGAEKALREWVKVHKMLAEATGDIS